jgi:hypothetical protein
MPGFQHRYGPSEDPHSAARQEKLDQIRQSLRAVTSRSDQESTDITIELWLESAVDLAEDMARAAMPGWDFSCQDERDVFRAVAMLALGAGLHKMQEDKMLSYLGVRMMFG